LEKPTKVMIAGLVIAAASVIGWNWHSNAREAKLVALETECRNLFPTDSSKDALDAICGRWRLESVTEPVYDAKGRPVYGDDGKPLINKDSRVGTIHEQIRTTMREGTGGWDERVVGALTLALVMAIPWAWYFLLRRIAELRDAITGRKSK
jgi:hypothetical protein